MPFISSQTVISMDTNDLMEAEPRIMRNYMIHSWCSNALSPALKQEAEGKAERHGVKSSLKTMRALRNAVRETTLVVRRPAASATSASGVAATSAGATAADDSRTVASTRRIMDFGEAHKMQSAPLFAGKYTDEGGW